MIRLSGIRSTVTRELYSCFTDESEFNYSIHISDRHNFVYIENPKSSCSTIKGTLNKSVAASLGLTLNYHEMADVHNRDANILLRPSELGYLAFEKMIQAEQVLIFSLIRDPVSRICSAYANKLAYKGFYSSKIRDWLPNHMRFGDDDTLSFDDFIDLICSNEGFRYSDRHWRPQNMNICYDSVPSLWLGRSENALGEIRSVLTLAAINQHFEPFDARAVFPHNKSHSDEYLRQITPKQRHRIQVVYRKDYDLLDHIGVN